MTRIALCYSGRPRSYQECHENHKQHFRLGQNDVDVFAHMWFDEDLVGTQFRTDVGQGTWPDAGVKEWIDENWKPKKIKYEKPRYFADMFNDTWQTKWPATHPKDNQISMFYGIEQAIKLKREYEEENNFKYDYVIRMRSDLVFLQSPGQFEDYDPSKLHVFDVQPGPDWIQTGVKDFAVLDIIAWGGSEVMDKYGTIYSNLKRITEEGCPMFTPDSSLGYNAKVINNLEYEKHNWNFKVFVANHTYGN